MAAPLTHSVRKQNGRTDMSAEVLSRIQFALTVSFHFLFPPLTIGLSVVLIIMQTLRLRTGNPLYRDLARFWTRVFGLIFAIGVATGIPLQFQFGTNWARYARFAGDHFREPLRRLRGHQSASCTEDQSPPGCKVVRA